MTRIEAALQLHLAKAERSEAIPRLREQFRAESYVELNDLLPCSVAAALRAETTELFAVHGIRRDLRMAATAQTPRRYTLLAYEAIACHGTLVPALYESPTLREVLGAIAGRGTLVPVPYTPERIIATRLERREDTHGWHWDDYPYALVWVLRVPSSEVGGGVELVPDTIWDKDDPQVERYLRERSVVRRAPAAGSAYLLRADTTLHRVAPLAANARREVLTFSYTDAEERRSNVTHETLEALLRRPT
jgi:hypothetical protein